MTDKEQIADIRLVSDIILPHIFGSSSDPDLCLEARNNADNIAVEILDKLGYTRQPEREQINLENVESTSHFGVVRDWVIKLKDGREIELSADIVQVIIQHQLEKDQQTIKEGE